MLVGQGGGGGRGHRASPQTLREQLARRVLGGVRVLEGTEGQGLGVQLGLLAEEGLRELRGGQHALRQVLVRQAVPVPVPVPASIRILVLVVGQAEYRVITLKEKEQLGIRPSE